MYLQNGELGAIDITLTEDGHGQTTPVKIVDPFSNLTQLNFKTDPNSVNLLKFPSWW